MSADQLFVKMCGLRDVTAARVAVQAGASALGFILAESKRQIAPGVVRAIREELEAGFDPLPPLVGVVVNEKPTTIDELVTTSGVDAIQLSGDETPAILRDIDVPVIKALRFRTGMSLTEALRIIESWVNAPKPPRHVLVDGYAEGRYGGTGNRADWSLVREVAEHYPVILAGGLNPENVANAVASVRPFGVDVAGGTETDGVKDPAKIRAFVSNARSVARQSR